MKRSHLKQLTLSLWGVIFLMGCPQTQQKNVKIDSDKSKLSYTLGYGMGSNLKIQTVDLDYEAFEAGLKDIMEGRQERLSAEQRRNILKKVTTQRRNQQKEKIKENLEKGKAFLEANKKKEGVQETDTGLQYKLVKLGDGPKPALDNLVEVHYKGTLIDGTVFDSSYNKKGPIQFSLKSVIPGWQEGLQLMKEGSKYILYIPPQLGYGSRGSSKIPGNSVLIFEVELLSVKEGGHQGHDHSHNHGAEKKATGK